jgi:hypothetical protein
LFDDQVPPDTLVAKEVFCPTQMFWFPLKVPAVGAAVTLIVLVAVALAQPPVPATV